MTADIYLLCRIHTGGKRFLFLRRPGREYLFEGTRPGGKRFLHGQLHTAANKLFLPVCRAHGRSILRKSCRRKRCPYLVLFSCRYLRNKIAEARRKQSFRGNVILHGNAYVISERHLAERSGKSLSVKRIGRDNRSASNQRMNRIVKLHNLPVNRNVIFVLFDGKEPQGTVRML